MDFALPQDLVDYLAELDSFIEAEIKPLEEKDDNIRFFDHRREHARTDWDNQGLPRHEWEALLAEARRAADAAGHLRYAWPVEWGGKGGSNLAMAVIREHLAARGLGLHNDLQTEHSIVGNNPFIIMFKEFATNAQYEVYGERLQKGEIRTGFGLTEPNHGSDATFMETRAVREEKDGVSGWRINGEKMWTTGMHVANYIMTFARTSGKDGDSTGITVFLVPASDPGVKIEEYLWTFNMPTDHPRVSLTDVWVPDEAIWGVEGQGLRLGQSFVHQNRIRQAASSLGAAVFCVNESVKYARQRKPFGKPLSDNQAIQWPLVELATQCEMLRLLIRKTAWEMDNMPHKEVERQISDKVSMCNYWSNRLVCEAADRAMQVHGGIGYSRHKPFEHIYRHHRRYRITEGSEEIQMRKVAAFLFGYMGPRRAEFAGLSEIMLSKADDFPIHQTPEPIAYSGTDRNFYDRYFFNGYNPDGSGFFAVALGVYPHLNIMDAHVSVIRDGVEHCVHASRDLKMERFDLEVGPIRIEVLEPLRRLKVTLAPTDGLAAEFVFEGRAFPIEEPRFIRRNGPRTFMDYTRLTQNGRYTGWIEIDGRREVLAPGCVGTRDRSWGVRPIGAPDPQPTPSSGPPGFFWQWTPMNFADRSVFFHFTADSSGIPWNTRAVVAPDGAGAADMIEIEHAQMAVTLEPGTRHARAATLRIPMPNSAGLEIDFEPIQTFLMRGIGYTHPKWGHGRYHGELEVEREDLSLASLDLNAMENLHIQALSRLTLREEGRADQVGLGVFEQLAFGPYPPLGL